MLSSIVQDIVETSETPESATDSIRLLLSDEHWRRYGWVDLRPIRSMIETESSPRHASLAICVHIALQLKFKPRADGWFEGDVELEEALAVAFSSRQRAFAAEGALLSPDDRVQMLKLHTLARAWWLMEHTETLPPHPLGLGLVLSSIRCGAPAFTRNAILMSWFSRVRQAAHLSWIAVAIDRALELSTVLERHNGHEFDTHGFSRLQAQLGIEPAFWRDREGMAEFLAANCSPVPVA